MSEPKMVGLEDPEGAFQPKQFHGSMKNASLDVGTLQVAIT